MAQRGRPGQASPDTLASSRLERAGDRAGCSKKKQAIEAGLSDLIEDRIGTEEGESQRDRCYPPLDVLPQRPPEQRERARDEQRRGESQRGRRRAGDRRPAAQDERVQRWIVLTTRRYHANHVQRRRVVDE